MGEAAAAEFALVANDIAATAQVAAMLAASAREHLPMYPATMHGLTALVYGPDFAGLARHDAIGLASHHILHASLHHSARMGDMRDRLDTQFDPTLWTIATDAIVNEALLLAGYALPRPALRLTALLADANGQTIPDRQALCEWDAERLYLRLAGGTGSDGSAARAHAHAHAAKRVFAPDLHPEAADKSFRIDPARLTHLPLLRRDGGTALAPALAPALGLAARLQPSVAVIPTDPDGDPGPAPRFPGHWTVPDDNGVTPPPFGRVLSMAR